MLRNPGVSYDHIAGLSDAKHALYDAIILPRIRPDIFKVK
jgi:SpoVK/Ycf46/Vps4 family AAA+-type ATPase